AGRQVEPQGQDILRERDLRVGGPLAGPHGGDHHGDAPERELVHQCGRGVVEQVSVVDPEQQRPAARPRGGEPGGRGGSRRSPPRRSAGGRRGETAPNGIEAAARVAASHSTPHPAASARARASRAILVLPTPASPASTTPRAPVSARTADSTSSSAWRPTSGHVTSTQASSTDRTGQPANRVGNYSRQGSRLGIGSGWGRR